jgi:MoaA/NifB/PqqE/SkfB family radical SAM enzyme
MSMTLSYAHFAESALLVTNFESSRKVPLDRGYVCSETAEMDLAVHPTRVAIEATSACQLRCPSCPTATGETKPVLGLGFLHVNDFDHFLRDNPTVRNVELSNYGEAFLHPNLPAIFESAHNRGVRLSIANGANLNNIHEGVLEALVKYRVSTLSVSIDGASQETYSKYRVGGDYETVIAHIRQINAYKRQFDADFPKLQWQFIVFGHNEHEIPVARKLATELGMFFTLKLAWGEFSPIQNANYVKAELGAGFASRAEYEQQSGEEYLSDICAQLWDMPRINWDGKLLGCCRNFWGEFGPNVFTDGFVAAINSQRMRHSRAMLEGKSPASDDSPCTSCSVYIKRRENNRWLKRPQPRRTLPPGVHAMTFPARRTI